MNHSEHKISFDNLKKTIKECNKHKLRVIVCTSNINNVKQLIKLKPFAIAYEDPKLIGSKDSITNYPTKILKFVNNFKRSKIFPLCGAGINNEKDVESAIILGCKGVLISSAVMKARNPKALLKKIDK